MPRFLPDTSCIIPSLFSWHEHHERAVREIQRRITAGETIVVAAPTLIEAYSVFTRMPPPQRVSPQKALELLEATFLRDEVERIGLNSSEYARLVRYAPERNIAGGHIYDAVIMACALAAGVDTLLTFNERQFLSLAVPGVTIVVPA